MDAIPPVRRLQDEAYDFLKQKILEGEFSESEIYSETKLTSTLGMSRTPVRDALLRLNMEGFIEILPSRGFTIKKVKDQEIKETLEIRCALEGYAAYVLAEQIDTPEGRETIFKLNESISQQERVMASANPNILEFIELNIQFHRIMVDFLQNNIISQTYNRLENKIKEMTFHRLSGSVEIMDAVLKAHIQIVALIRTGNKEQAYTRAKLHNNRDFF